MQSAYDLGVHFAAGRGVPKDDVKAVQWFQKAADQDLPQAEASLGAAYLTGQGIAKESPRGRHQLSIGTVKPRTTGTRARNAT